MTTAELVHRAQAGDTAAFADIYRQYRTRIFVLIRTRVPNDETAEDLTQETFIRALRHIGQWRDQGYEVFAWLCVIAKRLVIDEAIRARRRQTEAFPTRIADTVPAPGRALDEAITDRAVAVAALDGLTEEQRDVLALRFLGDLSVLDTAAVMGRSRGAVKALTYRALDAVRLRLGVVDAATVRAWAKANGIAVNPRGHLSKSVMAAYRRGARS